MEVLPREGSYKGMLPSRKVSVILDGFNSPSEVYVNGVEIPYSRFAKYEADSAKAVWGYDGNSLTATVYVPSLPADEKLTVKCLFRNGEPQYFTDGKKGLIRRMMALTPETKLMMELYVMAWMQLPSEFLDVAQCGSYITESPEKAAEFVRSIDVESMNARFAGYEKLPDSFRLKVTAQTEFERRNESGQQTF